MPADYTNIAKLRQAKGLTQEEVAAKMGCHLVTYSKYERGISRLTLTMAEKIAAALGASPSDFIAGLYSEADAAKMIEGADAKEQVASLRGEIARVNSKVSLLISQASDDVLKQVSSLGGGTVGQANAIVDQLVSAEMELRQIK